MQEAQPVVVDLAATVHASYYRSVFHQPQCRPCNAYVPQLCAPPAHVYIYNSVLLDFRKVKKFPRPQYLGDYSGWPGAAIKGGRQAGTSNATEQKQKKDGVRCSTGTERRPVKTTQQDNTVLNRCLAPHDTTKPWHPHVKKGRTAR